MKIARYPEGFGFIEFLEDRIVITGGDPLIIPREAVRSANCRDGKKSFLSRDPPAVFEIEYSVGVGTNRIKMLVPTDQKDPTNLMLKSWGLKPAE
jgi:hypothetical protein